jgi:hypothetical protein
MMAKPKSEDNNTHAALTKTKPLATSQTIQPHVMHDTPMVR